MKLARFLVILTALCLISSAAAAAVVGQNDKEVQTVAEPILDAVLNGMNSGDYALYSKYFDATMKAAMPENRFQRVRKDIMGKLGKYKSRTYLGFETKENFTVALWKGRFSKTANDVTIKLVLSKNSGKVQVAGLWFQ